MTIDETIELAREYAKNLREDIEFCVQKSISGCDECIHCDIPCSEQAEENEQIADWLEELNLLRLQNHLGRDEAFNAGRKQGYNKAIDDFVKFAKSLPVVEEEDGTIRPMCLEEIAEQLRSENNV